MPRFSLLFSETPLHVPRLLQETCVSRRCLCVHSTQCVPMIRSFKSQHLHSKSIDSDILLLVMHNSFTTHQVLLCDNHVSPAHAVMKFYDLLLQPVDILNKGCKVIPQIVVSHAQSQQDHIAHGQWHTFGKPF